MLSFEFVIPKEYSDDEDTKEKGGDLGYLNKGDYGSDEFDNEVCQYQNIKLSSFWDMPIIQNFIWIYRLIAVKNKV